MNKGQMIENLISIVLITLMVITAAIFAYNSKEYEEHMAAVDNEETTTTEANQVMEPVEYVSEVPIQTTEPKTTTEEIITSGLISLGDFKITAYCSCKKCCGKWASTREDGKVTGSIGVELIPDYSIAVDPTVIPYNSTVIIDGKEYIAHDTGGSMIGNRIDLYMASHEEALQWGVRYKEVFVEEGV